MIKIQIKILFTILFLTFFVNTLKCSAEANLDKSHKDQDYTLLLKTDFADKTVKPWDLQANPEDISVVLNPLSSENVMKAHINVNEDFSHVANGAPRAEIINSKLKFENDSEYIITFNTYLPPNFQIETVSSNPNSFFQIHQDLMYGSPQLALGIDEYNYRMTSNSSGTGFPDYKPVVRLFGNIKDDLGKWVKWSIYYKPSFSPNGRVLIFKDHRLMLDYTGITAYGETTAYSKFGIYKWGWRKAPTTTTDITTYFSDIRIYKKK